VAFWKGTERLANWDDHPHTHVKETGENAPTTGVSLFSLLGKVYAKCLEKRCREIIEPKLDDAQGGFRPGRSTTGLIFTLQQIFEKS